jgi:ubiquinone/menaquinone biosynthesis C-methylase UbiE
MKETEIYAFWQSQPCGSSVLENEPPSLAEFFDRYDSYRYTAEKHILAELDRVNWRGKRVLEIGLGQGADSEQIIRRGGSWSGIDLTEEALYRTKKRFELRNLDYVDIQRASALNIPYASETFDIVFSHGVLHHIPNISRAQSEIARVLKPGGMLVAMLYAKYSLNYLTIATVRRAGLILAYLTKIGRSKIVQKHVENARQVGLLRYLRMSSFVHRNTDGPDNPYSKVYWLPEVRRDFPNFEIVRADKRHMHAPPLPVHALPGSSLLGWHLWVHLRKL